MREPSRALSRWGVDQKKAWTMKDKTPGRVCSFSFGFNVPFWFQRPLQERRVLGKIAPVVFQNWSRSEPHPSFEAFASRGRPKKDAFPSVPNVDNMAATSAVVRQMKRLQSRLPDHGTPFQLDA